MGSDIKCVRGCHADFQSVCAVLHPTRQCVQIPTVFYFYELLMPSVSKLNLQTIFFCVYLFTLSLCMCACMHVPPSVYESQRITCWSQLSPSTFWNGPQATSLGAKSLYPLSQIASLRAHSYFNHAGRCVVIPH